MSELSAVGPLLWLPNNDALDWFWGGKILDWKLDWLLFSKLLCLVEIAAPPIAQESFRGSCG